MGNVFLGYVTRPLAIMYLVGLTALCCAAMGDDAGKVEDGGYWDAGGKDAGHDGGPNLGGIEVDNFPGAGPFQHLLLPHGPVPSDGGKDVVDDAFVVANIICHVIAAGLGEQDGRFNGGLPQAGDGEV